MSGDRRRFRLGFIGCGAWGPNHVRNFAALPNAEVVAAAIHHTLDGLGLAFPKVDKAKRAELAAARKALLAEK